MRPILKWFAGEMEKKLRENDHKGGWNSCDVDWLVSRMTEELQELDDVVQQYRQGFASREEVRRECADVANFAMMIADNIDYI